MANILEIAESLKTYCAAFADEAKVCMYPAERLGDQENGLVCIVKPNGMENVMESRNGSALTYEFEIGFLKWVADENESQELLLRVENFVKDSVAELLPMAGEEYRYVIRAIVPAVLYSVTAFNKRKQFASVLRVEVYDSESA